MDGNHLNTFLNNQSGRSLEEIADHFSKTTDDILHFAVELGSLLLVQSLIQKGAKVDRADKKGNTALHIAAGAGRLEIVSYLLEKGADINRINQEEKSVLYMAAQYNHPEIVDQLLAKGAKVGFKITQHTNTRDAVLESVLNTTSIQSNAPDAISQAVEQGRIDQIPDNMDDISKRALLVSAITYGQLKATEKLFTKDVIEEGNHYAIHLAAHYGRLEIIKLCLAQGVNINQTNAVGETALHFAVKSGHQSCVALLLKNGADIDVLDSIEEGEAPLHIAVKEGWWSIVEVLLDRGANINVKTREEGETPLHVAVEFKNLAITQLLIEKGADLTIDGLDTDPFVKQVIQMIKRNQVSASLRF